MNRVCVCVCVCVYSSVLVSARWYACMLVLVAALLTLSRNLACIMHARATAPITCTLTVV